MAVGGDDTGGIPTLNGGMVLIVEDDERISRLERFVLEQVGYRVTCAGSGEEALEILPNTTPSLVFLDTMLPQMDGFTTCRKIRECSQVPIIMVTTMDRDIDKVRGLEMGADDYITKPFSTHELASRVKSVLRRANGGQTKNGLAVPTPSKINMPFLHPRDEESGYPTQARLSEIGLQYDDSNDPSGDRISGANIGYDTSAAGAANPKSYEGTIRLVVETDGAVKEMVRFVDALRKNPQIHLLRVVSNAQRNGMDVLIRLRSPNPLQTTLLSAAGVNRVEAAEPFESDPETPVIKVWLA